MGTHRKTVKREEIAAIVDQFLSKKLAETPEKTPVTEPVQSPGPAVETQSASPVKTVIHELRPPTENGVNKTPVDFVSESDVRTAVQKGEKIYINSKTLITPAARDLGEEKDVFARG